ncbi:zinc ribbon domain-containing protein [Desulforamulus aquiferis]|uniref:zinc ribbon domain-containing protein n=1 Tax=Desulforamulus aquiferis TaxID=1397668 RepID=UPI0027145417|nr:zinc ribbon domain-containing protein [Desulforamulus aquiferis]
MQAKMDGNKKLAARYKAKVSYLLTGLIYCAQCGSALVGDSSSYKTKEGIVKNYYYDCNRKDRQQACDNPKTRKDLVENMVLDKLHKEIFRPERIAVICQKINDFNQSQAKEVNEELNHYKKELSDSINQLDNLVMAVANGAPYELFDEKIKDLQNKKVHLESKILKVELLSRRELITEEMISNYLNEHRQAVEEKDIDACKKFIHNYVEKVIVDKDDITIKIHFQYCGYGGGGGGS